VLNDQAGQRNRVTAPSNAWLCLALLGLTIAVYAPVRHHDFLNYDDNDYVTENPHVTAGLTRDSIVWAWTQPHSATWHPLTTLSHLLDCQLFGTEPGPPHLVNVALHALNTLLLFGVLVRMTARPWRSACVAALFAIHPIHIESVAWIAERKDVLSACFWMLTLWTYVAYVRQPRARRYALVLAAYVAALLSKPMVVTLPFTLLLLDLWPLERWGAGPGPGGGSARRSRHSDHELPRLVLEKLPLFILAGVAATITMITQQHVGAVVSLQRSSFGDRIANALVAYVAYLVKMLWPSGLAPIYPFVAPLPTWQVVGSMALLVAITSGALWQIRRRPYLAVGWLWYVGTLVPVIGLVQYGSHAIADRYTYVPSIGLYLIAAWGVPDLLERWKHRQVACAALAAIGIIGYALVASVQLRYWQDSVSLFRHTLAVTQNNAVAENHLGAALVVLGEHSEGARHLAAGDRINRATEAQHYVRQLENDPTSVEAHIRLGRLLADSGDTNGAAAHYREAIRLNPNMGAAHNNLAVILESTGQTDAAIAEYREVVRLQPERAESRSNLAAVLASAGRPDQAIEQFRIALQLKPQLVDTRFGLANAYAQAGLVREAIAELDELLRERPDWPAAEATLAWLLATSDDAEVRNAARAVQLAEDAARHSERGDPEVLNSLAAAYAAQGRFRDAADTAATAIGAARTAQRPALVSALNERLAQYRAAQAARESAGAQQP